LHHPGRHRVREGLSETDDHGNRPLRGRRARRHPESSARNWCSQEPPALRKPTFKPGISIEEQLVMRPVLFVLIRVRDELGGYAGKIVRKFEFRPAQAHQAGYRGTRAVGFSHYCSATDRETPNIRKHLKPGIA